MSSTADRFFVEKIEQGLGPLTELEKTVLLTPMTDIERTRNKYFSSLNCVLLEIVEIKA